MHTKSLLLGLGFELVTFEHPNSTARSFNSSGSLRLVLRHERVVRVASGLLRVEKVGIRRVERMTNADPLRICRRDTSVRELAIKG
jgi:hypothetical protein